MLFGTVALFSSIFFLPDGKLHIVFCNVGQGDAAYIRTPSNQDMLIDGGPDDKVLTCLGKHMPFYDRTIDIVLLTHPQKDHMQGLISVVQRYNVKYFVIGAEGNQTEGYHKLVQEIKNKNIPIKNLYTGDKFSLGQVEFSVLWPEKKWVAQHLSSSLSDSLKDTSDGVRLSLRSHDSSEVEGLEGAVLGLSTDTQLNDFSYLLDLKYGSFSALFTGDGDSRIQPEIMKTAALPDVDILKFPHHGSKYGATDKFLEMVNPELAVISSGKNPWGHPTKETLDQLKSRAIEIKRTDREGDIEIISDGRNWKTVN